MLVLTRKTSERITIDDAIDVKVLAIQGNRVKLGITAPGGVRIVRAEIAAHAGADGESACTRCACVPR